MSDRKTSYSGDSNKGWERSEGLTSALHKREDYSRSKKTEYAGVYDRNGNPILEKHGNRGSVSFTYYESQAMEGHTFTHNHPNDSCFSQADIDSAERTGLLEVRATTSTGKTHCLRRINPADAKRGFASGMGGRYERETSHYMDTVLKPALRAEAGAKPSITQFGSYNEYVRAHNAWVDKYNGLVRKYNARFDSFCSSWLRSNAKAYGWRYREEQR